MQTKKLLTIKQPSAQLVMGQARLYWTRSIIGPSWNSSSSFRVNNSWNLHSLSFNFHEHLLRTIYSNACPRITPLPDSLAWKPSSSGKFSNLSAYHTTRASQLHPFSRIENGYGISHQRHASSTSFGSPFNKSIN